jgi:4-alpha-glucanotransferase
MTAGDLEDLAARYGVASQYQNARGETVATDVAVISRLLESMGFSCGEDAKKEALTKTSNILPPAMVVRSEKGRVVINLNTASEIVELDWEIVLENGKRRTGRTGTTRRATRSCRSLQQLVLTDIPCGYHELRLNSLNVQMTLIVTPGRCWLPDSFSQNGRSWGISLQLYAVRSEPNWGIGDFTDLTQFVALAGRYGCDVIGLNPLHEMFPDNPEHASPYSPANRLFLNVLYIDVEGIPEFKACFTARALVDSDNFRIELERCRSVPYVDYKSVAQLKLDVLRLVHANFAACASPDRLDLFEKFVRNAGTDLANSSLFQALRSHFTLNDTTLADWKRWPHCYRSPHTTEAQQFAKDHSSDISFFNWLQWIADQQLVAAKEASVRCGMRIGLYRDLAVGCDRTGSETWARPDDFLAATEVGAPPDVLNPSGQNWGLPPLNPAMLRRNGYRPFIELVRANMRHAGALRIDHVMGLQRLYCIPEGLPASQGAYIEYPIDDLIGILALESHRNRCLVVGEDLGTVPPGFRERMSEAHILSYRVLFFEQDQDTGDFLPPGRYAWLSIAVGGSHDLPTLRSWLQGRDIELKRSLGLYPSENEVTSQVALRAREKAAVLKAVQLREKSVSEAGFSQAIHQFLGKTSSVLAITQLDDLLGEIDPVNVPATSTEHPNWRRKYSEPLDALTGDHPMWRLVETLGSARQQSGSGLGEPS